MEITFVRIIDDAMTLSPCLYGLNLLKVSYSENIMPNTLPLCAIDRQIGEYVAPRFARKSGQYECPECHTSLFLRTGDIRARHFAHYSTESTCHYYSSPTESQIHECAKILLKQLIEKNHPIRITRKCGACDEHETCEIRKLQQNSKVHLEYRFEHDGLKVADVAYTDDDHIVYLFEIFHTHKTPDNNRPEPWFEIDAATFLQTANTNTDGPLTIRCIRTGCGRRWRCKTCLDQFTCDGRGLCLMQGGRKNPDMVCKFNCQPMQCSRCKSNSHNPLHTYTPYIFNATKVVHSICKSCEDEIHDRNYFNVPYASKEHAKSLGCRFDPHYKKWYHRGPVAGVGSQDFICLFSAYEMTYERA